MKAHVGLGSNQGDRRRHLVAAVRALDADPGLRVDAVSRLWETGYVGEGEAQEPYLNACVRLDTELGPRDLLRHLQTLEARAGRTAKGEGLPRTLDLDLLLFGDLQLRESGLQVPHPRLAARRFVLEPLAEVDPELVVPGLSRRVADLKDDPEVASQDARPLPAARWWEEVTA